METASISACFILWEIISRPEIYEMVMKELTDAFTNWDEVDILKLEKLMYFNATIFEGLRYPSLPPSISLISLKSRLIILESIHLFQLRSLALYLKEAQP
jgi:hypothetical protein